MKISPYWCATCNAADTKNLYDILSRLKPGEIFLYKVRYVGGSDAFGFDAHRPPECVLMKRTSGRRDEFDDATPELAFDNVTDFYSYAENDQTEYTDETLDMLKAKVLELGYDFEDVPKFEIDYDDRNAVFTEDGMILIY